MTTQLVREFINFVDMQPRDKTIDHRGGDELEFKLNTPLSTWATCAVGEFYRHRTGEWLTLGDDFHWDWFNEMEDSGYGRVAHLLDRYEIDTYGELLKEIRACEVSTPDTGVV